MATRTEDSGAGARAVADGARPRAGTGLALGEPCQTRAWGPSPLTPRWRCRGWLHLDGHDTCACAGPQPVTLRSVAGRRQDPARVTERRALRPALSTWVARPVGAPPGTPPSSARLRGHRRLEGRSAVARRACHLSGPGARTPVAALRVSAAARRLLGTEAAREGPEGLHTVPRGRTPLPLPVLATQIQMKQSMNVRVPLPWLVTGSVSLGPGASENLCNPGDPESSVRGRAGQAHEDMAAPCTTRPGAAVAESTCPRASLLPTRGASPPPLSVHPARCSSCDL